MNEELEKRFITEFPKIFKREDFLLTVGDGWNVLIHDICQKVQLVCDLTGLQVVVLQVKEKFGTLHFYYHLNVGDLKDGVDLLTSSAAIRDLVSYGEIKSSSICEKCGSYGQVRSRNGWCVAICDSCD